jgi:UDP-N-acetylglucosamine 2-epimerase
MKAKRQAGTATWISIVGARPQFVKLSPFCRAVEAYNLANPVTPIDHQIIHTGQHYDWNVAEVFFAQMNIPQPRFNLEAGSGSHGTQLARMLARMESILRAQRPEWVIVYGDTNSSLAGALLAARLNFRLAHVEAGCRSGDLRQPEEQNRIVADQLSQSLLSASETAVTNLHREGIGVPDDPLHRRITNVGDLQLDALLQHSEIVERDAESNLESFGVRDKKYYLLTLHRAENTDNVDRMKQIFRAISLLELPVVFPVHPRTRQALERNAISLNGNLKLVPPQGYLQMLTLEKHALRILTDSGGIQKEAFYLNVPCVTLRDSTEWVETVELGANQVVGADVEAIQAAVLKANQPSWEEVQPYGDGHAARRIIAELRDFIE